MSLLSQDEMIQKVHNSIVKVIRAAVSNLYHLSIAELEVANPSLEEIGRLCTLFNNIVKGTDIDGHFTEAITVIGEAADAVIRQDSQCLVDCAYHLEDFLSRIKP